MSDKLEIPDIPSPGLDAAPGTSPMEVRSSKYLYLKYRDTMLLIIILDVFCHYGMIRMFIDGGAVINLSSDVGVKTGP